MDYSLLGYSTDQILQVKILEWVALPFSRGSYWPGTELEFSVSPALHRRYAWGKSAGGLGGQKWASTPCPSLEVRRESPHTHSSWALPPQGGEVIHLRCPSWPESASTKGRFFTCWAIWEAPVQSRKLKTWTLGFESCLCLSKAVCNVRCQLYFLNKGCVTFGKFLNLSVPQKPHL